MKDEPQLILYVIATGKNRFSNAAENLNFDVLDIIEVPETNRVNAVRKAIARLHDVPNDDAIRVWDVYPECIYKDHLEEIMSHWVARERRRKR